MSRLEIRRRAVERSIALGDAGAVLLKEVSFTYKEDGFTDRLIDASIAGRRGQYLKAIGISILATRLPVQTELGGAAAVEYVRAVLAARRGSLSEAGWTHYLKDLINLHTGVCTDGSGLMDGAPIQPVKGYAGARTKVNVSWPRVLRSLKLNGGSKVVEAMARREDALRCLFADQLCGVAIYASGDTAWAQLLVDWALLSIGDPKLSKGVTTVLKGVGLNSTREGAMLVETLGLSGRGVAPVDVDAELARRSNLELAAKTVVECEPSALRAAVRRVLAWELDIDKVKFEDLEQFWRRRWGWCVNGAHSNVVAKFVAGARDVPNGVRLHRRAFAECAPKEVLTQWDARSYYTYSEKLEAGKSRALFSGDSLTYFAFSHLLSAVEGGWRQRRVVLDPGAGGAAGMVERIRKNRPPGSVHLMLDFDDFNSQHSVESMQVVIDEVCEAVAYPAELRKKLVNSLADGHIIYGERVVKSVATLMSGHRATTFLNSVLNAAYLLMSEPLLEQLFSLHVGDDVYIAAPSFEVAAGLVEKATAHGFGLNEMKQSIGSVSFEFLRMSTRGDSTYAYFARSVASVVAGNWVSEVLLGEQEYLTSVAGQAWTLMNRSQRELPALALMVDTSVRGGVPEHLAREIVTGAVAVNGGPVRGPRRYIEDVVLQEGRAEVGDGDRFRSWFTRIGGRSGATRDYLSHCASQVEMSALQRARVEPEPSMVESSWMKSFAAAEGLNVGTGVRYRLRRHVVSSQIVFVEDAKQTDEFGVLLKYPLVALVKDRLSDLDLRHLLLLAGRTPGTNVRVQALGDQKQCVRVPGWVSFTDTAKGRVSGATVTLFSKNSYYV